MPTANVSPDLIWGVVKDTSAFLVKRRRTALKQGVLSPRWRRRAGRLEL